MSFQSPQGLSFVPSFTNHSHCGSIRSVATCKQYLASGSSDESIRLYSLKNRSEYGFLQQHNGNIVPNLQYILTPLLTEFLFCKELSLAWSFFNKASCSVGVMMEISVSGIQKHGTVKKHSKLILVELLPSQFIPLENWQSVSGKTEP